MNNSFIFLFLFLLGSNENFSQYQTLDEYTYEIDGRTRRYFLHLPENLSKNAPLVFVLHGYGGSAKGMIKFSQMNPVADKNGFAVCYPQGNFGNDNKNSWNAGYSNDDVDDIKFLSSLAHYLQNKYNLSSENTFCTGMSNGADMSYRLACQKPDIFSAAAPVAGCLMESTHKTCIATNPVPILEIHGTTDPITHWKGDPDYSEKYGGYLSIEETVDFWVKKNKCTLLSIDTLQDINIKDGSIVVTKKYAGGIDNHQVWLYTLVGGKHDWPGSWGNMDIIASEEIWKFFKLFLKNSSQ